MTKFLVLIQLFCTPFAIAQTISDQTSVYFQMDVSTASLNTTLNGLSDQQTIFITGIGEYTAGPIKSPNNIKLTLEYLLGSFSKGALTTDSSGTKLRFVNKGNLYAINAVTCGLLRKE